MNVHELTLQNYTAASGCPSACQPILYLGTAGSYGNEQINVVLGEGWQGLTVKAVFQPSGVPAVVPDGGGVISVPWEATQSVIAYPKGRISFQGYSSGRLVNTSDVFYVVGGSSAGTDNTPAPTPDEFQQFVDAVKSDADRAAQAAADAKAAVQEVKDAGTQAVTDIGNAKDSALEAIDKAREEAAGSISADVEGAKQAAAQAEQSAKDAAATLEKVQSAGQSALDDIATERQNTLSDIQNEGAKQQSAVAGAGTAALEAIGQTEQAAINQVRQAGATQASAVQSAGTTQISQVNSAGAAQVQAVKDEGAAQTSALDDAAAAHKTELEAIASHPPQPNTETGKWQVWNAETGAYQDTDALYQGGYYTPSVSEDGILTWQGSQEGMPELPSSNIKGPQGPAGLGVPTPTSSDAGKVPVVNADGTGYELGDAPVDSYTKAESDARYAPISAAIRPTASGNPANITDSVEWPLLGLKVYGKSTQTTSQLLPLTETSYSANGLTATLQEDGSLIVNGTPGSSFTNLIYISLSLSPGDYYIAGGENTSGHVVAFIEIKKSTGPNYFANQSFSVDGTETSIIFMLQSSFANAINNYRVPAMLNKGTKPLPVQKYSGTPSLESPMPIVSAGDGGSIHVTLSDGGSQSQTLTLSTPNGLPGIPVTSGGNYTIDGQQYRGNIRDYGAEVDTIAVEQIDSYNGEAVGDVWMSSTGQLTTGAQVVYALDTPTTQAIPATEMAAYRALHTYDGTTVVSTAEDVAGLEVKYVADAQKYIDDRLAAAESHIQEIAAAQLNAQTGG